MSEKQRSDQHCVFIFCSTPHPISSVAKTMMLRIVHWVSSASQGQQFLSNVWVFSASKRYCPSSSVCNASVNWAHFCLKKMPNFLKQLPTFFNLKTNIVYFGVRKVEEWPASSLYFFAALPPLISSLAKAMMLRISNVRVFPASKRYCPSSSAYNASVNWAHFCLKKCPTFKSDCLLV